MKALVYLLIVLLLVELLFLVLVLSPFGDLALILVLGYKFCLLGD